MFKLVVADDEPLERRAIRQIIRDQKVPIRFAGEARNGTELIELVETIQPEIVFVDIKMPGMDGLEATRHILSIYPETIIIIFSAYDNFEYAREGIKLGAYRYMLKPVKPDQLAELIDEAIGEVEARKQSVFKNRMAETRIEKIKPYIKQSLLYNLISGSLEFEDIENQKVFLNMRILPGMAIVIGVDCDLSNRDTERIKKKILYRLEKKQVSPSSVLIDTIGLRKIVILINESDYNGNKPNLIPKCLEELRVELSEMMYATVTIGIGRPYANFEHIRRSYLEARKAFKYGAIILGGNKIIHVNDLNKENDEEHPVYQKDEMTEHLLNGDWLEANEDLIKIVKQIMKSTESEVFKRARMMELLFLLSRVAIEEGVEEKSILCLHAEFYKKITLCDHLEDLAEYLIGISSDYKIMVNQANRSYANKMIKKSKKFINENYASSISLKEAADAVNLSRHYYSRLFKIEEKCTFSEYLTRTRLNAAKKYLIDPSLSMAQIAEMTGFSEASYFSRTFKKIEGLSPTEYREKLRT